MSDMDPGDCTTEPLFNPGPYKKRECSCGVTQKNLCQHSADLAHGIAVGKRPRNCLLSPDPLRDPFPAGY